MDSPERNTFVLTRSGETGTIPVACLPLDAGAQVPVRFETGDELLIPVNFLSRRDDGSHFLPVGLDEARRLWALKPTMERVIPVLDERLASRTRTVETGRVRVTKRVATREEDIDEPLLEETVAVERVPINRPVDQPLPARYEGETLVVPIYEELLVVEKRLVLKEELHITKRRVERHRPRRAMLRREEVTVERLPPRAPPERDESENPR